MATAPWFIIEFDYRSDEGPSHVGPFRTRKAANGWVESQRFGEASWTIIKLWVPHDGSR